MTEGMLTLFTLESKRASLKRPAGTWYELAPGPDDGKFWASDGAYFWIGDWESIAEPILADRLPGYDRHGRVCLNADGWKSTLTYLDDLCMRLKQADESAMVPVVASELPSKLLHDLERRYPSKRDALVLDLETLTSWCRAALRRWQCITVIGL